MLLIGFAAIGFVAHRRRRLGWGGCAAGLAHALVSAGGDFLYQLSYTQTNSEINMALRARKKSTAKNRKPITARRKEPGLMARLAKGPVICAVNASLFSARDWRRNALGGSNLVPEGGIGAFVARRLTSGLDIRLNTPVTRINWGGPRGQRCPAADPAGRVRPASCLPWTRRGDRTTDP